MQERTFRYAKLIVVMLLAVAVGASVSAGAWLVPGIAVLAAAVIVFLLNRKREGVTHDERDLRIAGEASRMTYSVFGIAATVLGATLIAMGERAIGFTLCYSVCTLLVLQAIFHRYYARGAHI